MKHKKRAKLLTKKFSKFGLVSIAILGLLLASTLYLSNNLSNISFTTYLAGLAGSPTPKPADITWNVQYYRTSHKNLPSLKGVTADLIRDVPTTIKGVSVNGKPFGDMSQYNFATRWEARVNFEEGQYVINGKANDGVRVWVNGNKVVDYWKDRATTIDYLSPTLNLNGEQLVEVEYYQMFEESYLTFDWTKVGGPTPPPDQTPTPIPSVPTPPTPTPSVPTQPPTGFKDIIWDAKYFRNSHKNKPTLKNVTADLVNGLPNFLSRPTGISVTRWPVSNDNRRYDFSIRWEAKINYNGQYVFKGSANDGIRIWVNGVKVLDDWKDRAQGVNFRSGVFNLANNSLIEVEYYQMFEESNLTLDLALPDGSIPPTPTPIPTPIPSPTSPPTQPPVGTTCVTGETYTTMGVIPGNDRVPENHADMNITLRGWNRIINDAGLKQFSGYGGDTDIGAPNLYTLYSRARAKNDIVFKSVYKVNNWDWQPPPNPGTRGGEITFPPVTMISLGTDLNEALRLPVSKYDLGTAGTKATVLYADEDSIALNYTGFDTVADGYTIHLENICVDKNLLSLYRNLSPGNTISRGSLPALKHNQKVGFSKGTEVLVAITDRGSFMDPRSEKDWWQTPGAPTPQPTPPTPQPPTPVPPTPTPQPPIPQPPVPTPTPGNGECFGRSCADTFQIGVGPLPSLTSRSWKIRSFRHLGCSENSGKQNLYVKFFDRNGNRLPTTSGVTHAYDNLPTNVVRLDKGPNDPAHADMVLWPQQGLSLINLMQNGQTENIQTLSNIKTGWDGLGYYTCPGTSYGHHSFEVVYTENDGADNMNGGQTPSPTPTPQPPTPTPGNEESLWNIKYFNFAPCSSFILDNGTLNPSEDPHRYYGSRVIYSCSNGVSWNNGATSTSKDTRNDLNLSPNAKLAFLWTANASNPKSPAPGVGTQFWTAHFDRKVRLNGNYVLSYAKDDGIKVFIKRSSETNYKRVLSDWNTLPAGLDSTSGSWTVKAIKSVPVYFPNDIYDIHTEYFQNGYLSGVAFDYAKTSANAVNYKDIVVCERGINCGANGEKDLWEHYQWLNNAISKGRPASKLDANSYIADNGLSTFNKILNFITGLF